MPNASLHSLAPRQGRARRLDAASLLAAAAELADRDGPEALTLAALAQAAGVKPPSLYAHLASLHALRRSLAAQGLRELEAEIARACVGVAGPEAVAAACHAYRAYARRRPGLYAATVLWTSEQDAAIAEAGAALKSTVLRILAPSVADPAEQIHLLRLLRIALHGHVALEAAHAFGEPVNVEETFARLVASLTALVPTAPAAATPSPPARTPPPPARPR